MGWVTPFDGGPDTPQPTSSVLAVIRGTMAWTLARQAHCTPEQADQAIGRHITGLAVPTPAGTAAIMQSAYEDLTLPEERS